MGSVSLTGETLLADPIARSSGNGQDFIIAVKQVDATGVAVGSGAALTAGTNRSGTAQTTSGVLAPANANRKGLNIQNIGANNIGVNEFGGTAAIGTAGTYTIVPNGSLNIRTSNAVNVIAATAATAYSATEF